MQDFKNVQSPQGGFAIELWYFLRQSQKWWVLPIVAVFVLLGILTLLSGTAAAPFIYTLF